MGNILKTPLAALVLVLIVPIAIYVQVEWGPGGRYPGDEFFDLAAQTIPILLVALAVEAQARRFDESTGGKWMRIAAVVLLSVGEISAVVVAAELLDPAYGSLESKMFVVLTAAGLIGGFLAVIAVALLSSPERASPPDTVLPVPPSAPPSPASSLAPAAPARSAAALATMGTVIGITICLLARER